MLCNQVVEKWIDGNNYARYAAVITDVLVYEEIRLGKWNNELVIWICGNTWQSAGAAFEKLYNCLMKKIGRCQNDDR